MIRAEHLFKRYGARTVVSDLSLSVEPGEVLGFIGPNGAGKTTTMKMLCGVMPVYRGRVSICGIDLSENPFSAKRKIGYLPENAPLHPTMDVLSFLRYAAIMRGVPRTQVSQKVELAVRRCALNEVLSQEIESLSKGYKRRVCLAQSILHEPEVLIMDEPTDGLDPNQKQEVRELIRTLRDRTAIIISTHILEEVDAVCSRVLLLRDGKSVFDGTSRQFKDLAQSRNCTLPELFSQFTLSGKEDATR